MTGSPRPQLPIWCLTGAIGAIAAVTWLAIGTSASPPPGDGPLWWGLLLLAFMIGHLVEVPIEYRGQLLSVGFTEVALVVGLGFFPPLWILVASLVANAAASIFRLHLPPLKLCFNLAVDAAATGAGVAIYLAIAGGSEVVQPLGWLGAYSATLVVAVVSSACVIGAIALYVGQLRLAPWTLGFRLAGTVVATGVGLMAAVVIWVDWRGLWLVAGMFVTMAVAPDRASVKR